MKKIVQNLLDKKYAPYLISFILITPSLLWVFIDNRVWPWDQAWYGEVSVDLYYKFLNNSFFEWTKSMGSAFGIKAPAIAWFGQFFVPLSTIVGTIDRALMIQIIFIQFLSLVFIYRIVLLLTDKNKKLALLGTVIMASAPLFIGMGHQYFVESLQLFAVIFFIFIIINIGVWNKYNSIIAIFIVFAYAMLVKITSPLYLLLMMILGLFYFMRIIRKNSAKEYFKKKTSIFLYLIGISFLFAVFSWYVINWDNIYQFMKLASSGSAAELYGTKSDFLTKFRLWLVFFQKSFFISTIAYMIYCLLGFFLFQCILKFKQVMTVKNSIVVFLVSLGSIFLVLIFFSFQINEETRYLLPILPYIVIAICLILNKMKNNFLIIFFLLIFFLQYFLVNSVALGIIKNTPQGISSWVMKKNSSKDDLKNIKALVKKTCVKESEFKINIVGVEFPWLNANSVSYYAMQDKLKTHIICYYTSLGYAENNVENAWRRFKSINPPFFIISDNEVTKNLEAFNGVSSRIIEKIKVDPDFVQQDFSQSNIIKIFKNVPVLR